MASFRTIPLGIYTLGPPRLPQLEASPELPLPRCFTAMPDVRLASSWYVRIFGTLTGFSSLWTERRHRGLGRESTVLGGQQPCCFGLKIAEQTKPRGLARCRYAKVTLCTPVVWVLSPDILPQATQDIVNRTLSALMDESADIFHIFISPTSRWTT
jgi:hypothetical protein